MSPVTRGFFGRRRIPPELADRVPPGQYVETGFPVLTAGPTPRVAEEEYALTIDGLVGASRTWTLPELRALPRSTFDGDIHCVTTWSKLGTSFGGVSVDTLLELVEPRPEADARRRELLRRLHDEPAARGRHGRQGLGRLGVGGPAPAARARRPRALPRPARATSGSRRSG